MIVGTSAVPRATISSTRSSERPVPCSMQSMPAADQAGQHARPEAVGRHLRALGVGGVDRRGERLGGEARRQVALVAVDPVPHQLDPPVAGAGLLRGVRRQLVGLDLVGVVADVALGAADVATAADQPRQVVAVLDPAGVGGAAGVTDQQRPPSRSSTACCSVSSSVVAPKSSSPRWQWASTSPGTIQPSPPVSAPACRS